MPWALLSPVSGHCSFLLFQMGSLGRLLPVFPGSPSPLPTCLWPASPSRPRLQPLAGLSALRRLRPACLGSALPPPRGLLRQGATLC